MTTATIDRTNQSSIHWKQLASLAALYGSVLIGWIAYYRYQPKLLVQYGFTDFTLFLVIAQGIILVVTPPIAGRLGDRFRFKAGHRLPIISSGISFAAMIFMAVAFTLFAHPGEILKWVLPLMIVCWLVGMSIFTSPALSTVELFAPVEKLPMAMAVLTIVSNLVNALEPVIVNIIDYLGAPLTFMAGGVAVFFSGYALKRNSLDLFKQNDASAERATESHKKTAYLFILLMGIATGFVTTMLMNIFPSSMAPWAENWFHTHNDNIPITVILVISAIFSLPASSWVNRWSLRKSFWGSWGVTMVCTLCIIFIPGGFVVALGAVGFGIAFSVLSVSSLPLVIGNAAFREKVLAVGIFFSGVAIPDGIVETILAWH